MSKGKTPFRWSPSGEDDVLLLGIVCDNNPMCAGHGRTMSAWTEVAQEFIAQLARLEDPRKTGPTGPTTQARVQKLIDIYKV